MAGKNKRDLARERLRADMRKALKLGGLQYARQVSIYSDVGQRLAFMDGAEARLVDAVIEELDRNWRVSERPRGERVAT